MATIKNFGIAGVGSQVQFGKGGAQLVQAAGTFAARNASGNAFVRFQIADGAAGSDAVSFQQLSNAVNIVNAAIANTQSQINAIETGAGLNSNGTYTAPAGTKFLGASTSLANASALLDAAIFAETTRATAAETALAANVATLAANATTTQNELNQVISSVGLTPLGNLVPFNGTYTTNASTVYNAIDALDAALTSTAANVASNAVILQQAVSDGANTAANLNTLQGNVAVLTGRVAQDEVNAVAAQQLISGLRTDVDANAVALQGEISRAEAAEAALAANAVSANAALAAETLRAETAEASLLANAVGANAALAAETLRATTAEAALLANAVGANAALAAETQRATTAEAALLANAVGANAALAAETTRAMAAETALTSNVTALQGSYVARDGSIPMTGSLNLSNHALINVATGVAPTDAVNVSQLQSAVASLGNAFDYIGALTPGPNAGNAVVLPSGDDAGAYYKATADGYFIGNATDTAGAVAFHVYQNDGIVRNTAGGWDTIAHTESAVMGTAGFIDVTGSVDTGYTVTIDPAYTATIDQAITNAEATAAAATATLTQALSDEANTRAQADTLLGNSIVAETARAEAAEAALQNSVANAASVSNAALQQEIVNRTNAVANEATLRAQGDAALANAITNEANARVQADSDLSNAITSNVATLTARFVADEAAANALANTVAGVNSAVAAETTRATAAEAVLTSAQANTNANVATLTARVSADEQNANALANTVAQNSSNIANNAAAITLTNANAAALQTEVNTVITAAGLTAGTGAYVAPSNTTYLATANSLANADVLLDNAIASVANSLATLSQDTIRTSDGLNSVHVGQDYVATSLNVNNAAVLVANTIAGPATNTVLTTDFSQANSIVLTASGPVGDNIDLRLAAQGAGHVIVGETGVGYIQSDAGYDMTVAAGSGANLNLIGTNVNIQDESGANVAVFTGVANAGSYATVVNGNSSVTLGAAGSQSNLDLVFAPKGTGVVNVSGTRIVNVAPAQAATDAVNLAQLRSAVTSAQTGAVQTVSATLPATSGTVNLGSVMGTVLRVRVIVNNAYDTGSTIVVGDTSTANSLTDTPDSDESTAGIYVSDVNKSYANATTLTATVTNNTGSNGSATVIVEYLV